MALNGDADRCYGQLRADLERRGQLIGANDMLIAAHALAIEAVLVTDNTDEFSAFRACVSKTGWCEAEMPTLHGAWRRTGDWTIK